MHTCRHRFICWWRLHLCQAVCALAQLKHAPSQEVVTAPLQAGKQYVHPGDAEYPFIRWGAFDTTSPHGLSLGLLVAAGYGGLSPIPEPLLLLCIPDDRLRTNQSVNKRNLQSGHTKWIIQPVEKLLAYRGSIAHSVGLRAAQECEPACLPPRRSSWPKAACSGRRTCWLTLLCSPQTYTMCNQPAMGQQTSAEVNAEKGFDKTCLCLSVLALG